jgi:formaldehyde-activating enzyme involved in methanogenesis
MSDRILLRTGEALVEAEPGWSAAEPEVVIGELGGPVGHALAQLLGGQVKGHTRVFAIRTATCRYGRPRSWSAR